MKLITVGSEEGYAELAFWCFDAYINNGLLKSVIKEEEYENTINMKNFDYELMDDCLAKYGMECTEVYSILSSDDCKFVLKCKLHEDDDSNDDEN